MFADDTTILNAKGAKIEERLEIRKAKVEEYHLRPLCRKMVIPIHCRKRGKLLRKKKDGGGSRSRSRVRPGGGDNHEWSKGELYTLSDA